MGISNDAIAWPDYFIESMLKKGYRVIRFDNRGTGMSDWIPEWESNKYSLNDMSSDCIAIMNKLGIKKFHIVAVSLGGMIGQQVAILYPERVLSLASIMSSGYITDPESPKMNMGTVVQLVKVSLKYSFLKSSKQPLKILFHSPLHHLQRNSPYLCNPSITFNNICRFIIHFSVGV